MSPDQQSTVAGVDINPLLCTDTRVVAVDALIVRQRVPRDPEGAA